MFKPNFTITPEIMNDLLKLRDLRQEIDHLPMSPVALARLRETARLNATHYSTMIEGNTLTPEEINKTIYDAAKIPGKEHDQFEVMNYYKALDYVDVLVQKKERITEEIIKYLHAITMAKGKKPARGTEYRDGQNVIRDSTTGRIVYLPPEAQDVPQLMHDLVAWLQDNKENLPAPLRAGIAHYQFATIHPYYDGNGRTARLLATLILHLSEYDLNGFYSLEEYYAKNLNAYYEALSVGPSHNYYVGRAEADIASWLAYFCAGMVQSFESVKKAATSEPRKRDISQQMRLLNKQQQVALSLFEKATTITSHDIAAFFNLKPRTARHLCHEWVEDGFLIILNASKKKRRYGLNSELSQLFFE
jgi:Fic family protein